MCFEQTRRAEQAELVADARRLIGDLAGAIDQLDAEQLRALNNVITELLAGDDR